MIQRKKVELTKRQKQVLILFCKEKKITEIAKILKVGTKVIEAHKTRIYKKTKAKSPIGLFKYAVINKLFLFKGVK